MIRLALRILALAIALPAMAQSTAPKVYAAGSLKAALTEVATVFRIAGGSDVMFEFGPSGILRDRLAKGEAADLFASANMEHPKALVDAGKAQLVRAFARNKLCALVSPKVGATTDNLLEKMLSPGVKLATSTPKADPSGDYAWQVFERAEKLKPGAFESLSKKALQLVGGPTSPPPPKDRSAYGVLVANGSVDIFLTYCTGAALAKREEPTLEIVALPETLAVGAEYGLAVMNGVSPSGERFAAFILSPAGQSVLASHGFSAP
ncbi:Molybdate-binding protein ModA [Usitatibacter rugosus]|uniref:Molybdate-binding protein ModA n=1 Tax=Usitatibacter rugosus TaxID=2732067 RepID=A0A6M4GR78_9PROT|nr:molybdate ABC transporter substrate-binding protein [Usitatibacter rugosus]QJR09288.1 Molybdate-binding protein ModA [Usitatibacter rugosus]